MTTNPEYEALSTAEKIPLLQEAWDRISDNPRDVRLTDAQEKELDCRLADLEERPDDCTSWEETRERIRKK